MFSIGHYFNDDETKTVYDHHTPYHNFQTAAWVVKQRQNHPSSRDLTLVVIDYSQGRAYKP